MFARMVLLVASVLVSQPVEFSHGVEVPGRQKTHLEAYRDAYIEHTEIGTPLLVLVGAEWCEPCQQLKARLLEMRLNDFVFAYVDVTTEAVSAKIMRDGYLIPQLVIYDAPNSRRYDPEKQSLQDFLYPPVNQRKATRAAPS